MKEPGRPTHLQLVDGDVPSKVRFKVLLAEGALTANAPMRKQFKEGEIGVVPARSTEEFMEFLDAGRHFDAYVIDARSHGSSSGHAEGAHLFKAIRLLEQMSGTEKTPIVVCTDTPTGWDKDAIDDNTQVYLIDNDSHVSLSHAITLFLNARKPYLF